MPLSTGSEVSNRLRELVSREFSATMSDADRKKLVSNRLRELVSREFGIMLALLGLIGLFQTAYAN